jgi:tetratricopeptide (TPR) repeat protein
MKAHPKRDRRKIFYFRERLRTYNIRGKPNYNLQIGGFFVRIPPVGVLKQKKVGHFLHKARWYSGRNRSYKACVLYHKAISQDPENSVEAVRELAALYFERFDFELAAVCYRHLLEQGGSEQEKQGFALRLTQCYSRSGSFGLGMTCFSQISEWLKEFEEEALQERMVFAYNLGDNIDILRTMGELIKKYPKAEYYLYLASMLFELNFPDTGLEMCKKGLRRMPYSEELHGLKAGFYLQLRDYKKARETYLKLIRNHMHTGAARMDVEDYVAEHGPVPELMDVLRYLDEYGYEDYD